MTLADSFKKLNLTQDNSALATKTLLFKSKKSQLPILVLADANAPASATEIGKKINVKDLRAADDSLWTTVLKAAKADASPFNLDSDCHIVLDQSLSQSSTPIQVKGLDGNLTSIDSKTLTEILQSNATKFDKLDFAAPAASPATSTPAQQPSSQQRKQAGKIAGAAEVAIGIRKEVDFPNWYTQVLLKGDMLDYYDVSGCYILKPWSFNIWQSIQKFFDAEIQKIGVENCYFPLFVSSRVLNREKDHIEGFAPEVAWVTKAGESDLEEPIAIRPTSETVMYPYYAKWIRSHRDLPLRLNQWNSVVRWEFKNPQPFLRTREFLWQEGHTAHIDHDSASEEVDHILDLYRRIYEELLAVPVIPGIKSENEKFAGGFYTKSVEGYIPTTGRGIQGGTSHCLGQNFSKMFDITVEDPEIARKANAEGRQLKEGEAKKFVWQNSWGLSTRTIGVMVMVHGDDQGLVLPPPVASVQVVVVPCGITAKTSAEDAEAIEKGAKSIADRLQKVGVRAKADLREGYTPGWKFNDWEMRGVPIRIEYGPMDMKKEQALCVRRAANPNQDKEPLPLSELETGIPEMLKKIYDIMFNKAKDSFNDSLEVIMEDFDRIVKALNEKKVLAIPWCEEVECEKDIKERTENASDGEKDEKQPSQGAKSLCIPNDQERFGKIEEGKTLCVACKKPAKRFALFGRSY
ncbi:proline-tRNA ligase [Wallemia mellicola]|uniref:proline--tRNA ligase n=1 Tax=Wallemia mellicola TaxID=1708541 RepID=A0A4T0TWH2_9BASI|nr:proline-tRNA ligase [Wallemia mellicola]TIC69689.1 proline-tRNA ligase [Wallemia mellicola]